MNVHLPTTLLPQALLEPCVMHMARDDWNDIKKRFNAWNDRVGGAGATTKQDTRDIIEQWFKDGGMHNINVFCNDIAGNNGEYDWYGITVKYRPVRRVEYTFSFRCEIK
jgi:hypothetical protein